MPAPRVIEDLDTLIKGHPDDGKDMCLSSIYVELAFAAASYLYETSDRDIKGPSMERDCETGDLLGTRTLQSTIH